MNICRLFNQDEIRAFPHPRSEEAVAAYAYKWGSTAGLPAAEAFQLVYSIERIG